MGNSWSKPKRQDKPDEQYLLQDVGDFAVPQGGEGLPMQSPDDGERTFGIPQVNSNRFGLDESASSLQGSASRSQPTALTEGDFKASSTTSVSSQQRAVLVEGSLDGGAISTTSFHWQEGTALLDGGLDGGAISTTSFHWQEGTAPLNGGLDGGAISTTSFHWQERAAPLDGGLEGSFTTSTSSQERPALIDGGLEGGFTSSMSSQERVALAEPGLWASSIPAPSVVTTSISTSRLRARGFKKLPKSTTGDRQQEGGKSKKMRRLRKWLGKKFFTHPKGKANQESKPRTKLFGVTLEEAMPDGELPPVIKDILVRLQTEGPSVRGVFRVPCDYVRKCEIRTAIDKGEQVDIYMLPVSLVCALLKNFLNEIPDSIFGETFTELLAAGEIKRSAERIAAIEKIIAQLPPSRVHILSHVFSMLAAIAEKEYDNLMGSVNLAILLAPSLLSITDRDRIEDRAYDLVGFMIDNAEHIFRNNQPSAFAQMTTADDVVLEEEIVV